MECVECGSAVCGGGVDPCIYPRGNNLEEWRASLLGLLHCIIHICVSLTETLRIFLLASSHKLTSDLKSESMISVSLAASLYFQFV